MVDENDRSKSPRLMSKNSLVGSEPPFDRSTTESTTASSQPSLLFTSSVQQQHAKQPPPHQQQPRNDTAVATATLDAVDVVPVTSTRSRRRTPWLRRGLWKRHKLSLSRASSTPCFVTLLIPLLSLLTHAIFYYGQTQPMWHLHLSQQVDVWANATNLESRAAFDTMGLPHQNLMASHEERQVKTFSYWYAIQELWKAKHMPGKVLPRAAAILLVIFSGIWPHLKLLLLNCTWLFSIHQQRRTRMLTWLSTLGKWSLADVLVVCVMVGVLHLDWNVDPEAVRIGLVENLPFCLQVVKSLYSASDICTILLKDVDCHIQHKSWKRWSECKACVGLVKTALDNPERARDTFRGTLDGIQMSGGGHVTLRVLGLHGIYAFCAAVILSILISLLVDVLDGFAHRANARTRRQRHLSAPQTQSLRQNGPYLLIHNGGGGGGGDGCGEQTFGDNNNNNDDGIMDDSNQGDSYGVEEPSLMGDMDDDDEMEQGLTGGGFASSDEAYQELIRSTASPSGVVIVWSVVQRYALLILCLITLGTVSIGILTNTIERNVHGAIPDVLRDILGVIWNRKYSLWTLVQTTGAAGGMDHMLMATFGLFVILGPASRAFLCLLAWIVPWQGRKRRKLFATIELVGAFCAWEVFAVAVGMVDMLMPAITSTVVMRPELCSSVSEDGTCLQVNFDLQRSFFLWVVGGGILLIAVSNLAFGSSGRRPPSTTSYASLTTQQPDEQEVTS
ncbi:hypothetical protein ACA910_017585 [Epithemia clementina (nom. ined.)]